ncbi:hypothetical protein BD310DRAFT_937689 [Dichomitus squalens]|uniref:Uncharacterized protein n=1 Tax=Dichomitus squalens TaxID=114155 RepID=A0A4Q9PHY2_9APHY|nr:hypothetical protein BD310DRAFT_937689 [Dichomitus squalens]
MSTMTQPIGKRFLMRKSSNAENLPPPAFSKKADALVSAREASRRRRARVVSGHLPLKAKKVIQNMQRRASKTAQFASKPVKATVAPAKTSLPALSAPAQVIDVDALPDAVATQAVPSESQSKGEPTLNFPRFLRRPPPSVWPVQFERENIDACHPDIAENKVPFEYLQDALEAYGSVMWDMVKGARIDRSTMGRRSALPDEVSVFVADHIVMRTPPAYVNAPTFPTHVLAVWELPFAHPVRRPSAAAASAKRKVSLIPIHNLNASMFFAKWFKLVPSNSPGKRETDAFGVAGTELKLPVVPLAVPHPESFLLLLQTAYVHKVSFLLDQLVPVQKPVVVFPTPENPRPQNPHYIDETGRRLAARYTPQAIIEMIGMVIGLWQNAIYLGASDRRLWVGIDWSYDMLLTGLGYALGHPELVPRPDPSQYRWAPVQVPKA